MGISMSEQDAFWKTGMMAEEEELYFPDDKWLSRNDHLHNDLTWWIDLAPQVRIWELELKQIKCLAGTGEDLHIKTCGHNL